MKNQSPFHKFLQPSVGQSRREFLWRSGGGLGGIALASLLGGEGLLGQAAQAAAGNGPRPGMPHHPPRAKRVVQLFMGGAASHLDLFDYKPVLKGLDTLPEIARRAVVLDEVGLEIGRAHV